MRERDDDTGIEWLASFDDPAARAYAARTSGLLEDIEQMDEETADFLLGGGADGEINRAIVGPRKR